MTREFRDRYADRKALILRSDSQNTSLVMFVHGWQGGYLSTWMPVSDMPRKAADAPGTPPSFARWDYLFLGYETRSVETYLDIASRVFSEWQDASIGDGLFPHKYSHFVLVGHSLGTLGIRQALVAQTRQPGGFLKSIHGVLLFGKVDSHRGYPLGFWGMLGGIGEANATLNYAFSVPKETDDPLPPYPHYFYRSL